MMFEPLARPVYYSKQRVNRLCQEHGYHIIDNILIGKYDKDWSKLVTDLKQTKKEIYNHNEKYIVHHGDTEYFLGNFGFVAENFNRSIRFLDIDPCRFVVYTNHRGSTPNWLQYCKHEHNQFTVIETPWTNFLCDEQNLKLIPTGECRYHFCATLGQGRPHRDKLVHWIKNNNLHKNNIVVYHNHSGNEPINSTKLQSDSESIRYLSTIPFSRVNEEWSNTSRFSGSRESLHTHSLPPFQLDTRFNATWYQDIFFDLVAETVFHYPHAYISEKTTRPILRGRPFVIVGAANTLTWLHEMGFRTFDSWWDESYDHEQDPDARLEKIFATIREICSWSNHKCQIMLRDMIPVLEHNQKIYRDIVF
jgi:hypothetical protein